VLPEARRTIQIRPDAIDSQTTAPLVTFRNRRPGGRPPPFRNVDAPPAAFRPPPSTPWSVYHSFSIVPVDAVTPPERLWPSSEQSTGPETPSTLYSADEKDE
jgi:hypothetical protein